MTQLNHGAQFPDPPNRGVQQESLPDKRACPVTMPNSGAQPMVYLVTKPILKPHPTLGHNLQLLLIAEYSLRPQPTMKPSPWPYLNLDSSQWQHLVSKHSLRPSQPRSVQSIACHPAQSQKPTSGTALSGNTA